MYRGLIVRAMLSLKARARVPVTASAAITLKIQGKLSGAISLARISVIKILAFFGQGDHSSSRASGAIHGR